MSSRGKDIALLAVLKLTGECPRCGKPGTGIESHDQCYPALAAETKPLVLPRISKFDRNLLHLGCNPALIYSPDDLEIYERIKAQEEKDREQPKETGD